MVAVDRKSPKETKRFLNSPSYQNFAKCGNVNVGALKLKVN